MSDVMSAGELATLAADIDRWLGALRQRYPQISAIDRGEEDDAQRWYVRLHGEDKDVTTIWLTLRQRTLRYETYVLPAPEENQAMMFEHLLRRNDRLVGAHFSIGEEDAVYLRGELPARAVDERELDRIIGTLFGTVEQTFQGLLRIAFASRFR